MGLTPGFPGGSIPWEDGVSMIDRSGSMQVLRLDDHFELLAVSELGEGAYATPAFVGDRIYIRGATHLFCIAERKLYLRDQDMLLPYDVRAK